MPVGAGARFFRVALSCFLNQTYTGRLDVLVLDNSTQPIEHLLPQDERVKYLRCERMSIGALRNLGAAHTVGDIIVNGDEDDWSSADRVAVQLERLQAAGKSVTGFHNLLFYDTSDQRCYRYQYGGHPPYAVGTSQMYTRSWWGQHPFQAISKGEDFWFQKDAADAGQLDSCDCGQLAVARGHGDSTCPPSFGRSAFPLVPSTSLPREFWLAVTARG